ncbi:hypothetical protein LP414_18720 [Polaromonas sp. P1(28)-13]|nr:hypothetical protein LP414_18720 [Polaromonas sp. P1(28)-13]
MKDSVDMTRRQLLGASVAAGGLAVSGALLSVQALAADKVAVNMQLGWLAGGQPDRRGGGQAAWLLRAGGH